MGVFEKLFHLDVDQHSNMGLVLVADKHPHAETEQAAFMLPDDEMSLQVVLLACNPES